VSKGPDAFRTISEVAEDLNLPQHVLRFWETRFTQIRPMKRGGGRRYYRPDDIDLLRGIRQLLYGEGYTIKGVQRILKEHGARFVVGAGRGEMTGLSGLHRAEDTDTPEDEMDEVASVGFEADEAADGEISGNGEHVETENGGAFAHARRLVGRLIHEERAAAGATDPTLAPEEIESLQSPLSDLLYLKALLDPAR
jgi:DNA-binding transcriptional MerR regulator